MPLLQSRWRFVVFGALAAFVVVDILLVWIAAHGVAPQPVRTPGPIPTFTSKPTPERAPRPSASSTAGAAASGPTTSAPTPLLSAVSATEAWRATSGTCLASDGAAAAAATAATREHTTDGGATWTPVALGSRAVDTVVALDATSSATVVVGRSGSTCAVVSAESFTSGQFWAAASARASTLAYIATANSSHLSVLHLSTGLDSAPCADPERVVEDAADAALVCSDGLHIRVGTGAWSTIPVTGVVAVAPTSGSFTIARTGVAGCLGIAVQSLATPVTLSSSPSSLGCVGITGSGASLTQGTVALAQTGSDVWLWAGQTTVVSTDGGVTW